MPTSLMLVDDSATFLNLLTRFLQQEAADDVEVVGTAMRGTEAILKASVLQPKMVLLDLNMPDLSGLEALPLIREMLPDASIIALTLLDAGSYRKVTLDAGADEFISKTTLEKDLLPAIRRLAAPTGRQASAA
jgi:DNA-binding NarL/FixJ family response regulator